VSKNPEFYADFRSEEIIQKKCTEKELETKTILFPGLGRIFKKNSFWDYLFSVFFLLNPSDLKSA
jgi:hypothetical protein